MEATYFPNASVAGSVAYMLIIMQEFSYLNVSILFKYITRDAVSSKKSKLLFLLISINGDSISSFNAAAPFRTVVRVIVVLPSIKVNI